MSEITCAFCKGVGKDPFDFLFELAICQVCGGTGKVKVGEPAVKCAFCKGTGAYSDSRVTCTVCGGKGIVAVDGPTDECPECKGRGAATSGLPCLKCQGKGVVARDKEVVATNKKVVLEGAPN